MRGAHRLALGVCGALLLAACNPKPDDGEAPDWQKPPEAYDVQGADLTFNKARLEAFNLMSATERQAHIDELKAAEGSFKGMAVFKDGSELGEKMDDAVHGKHEIFAVVDGTTTPVLYEIGIDYHLYSDQDFYTGIPKGTHIEFTGTLVDLEFQDSSKPRKLTLKVKASRVDRMQ